MKNIFSNEDRIWRDRGERPGDETITGYMNWILPEQEGTEKDTENKTNSPNHFGHKEFGGFVLFGRKQFEENQSGKHNLRVSKYDLDIVAYAIGDYTAHDRFEIFITYVHENYRRMGISIHLYLKIIEKIVSEGAETLCCDVIEGTVSRLIDSSLFFHFLNEWGFFNKVIQKMESSYQIETRDENVEQFERVEINAQFVFLMKMFYQGVSLNLSLVVVLIIQVIFLLWNLI